MINQTGFTNATNESRLTLTSVRTGTKHPGQALGTHAHHIGGVAEHWHAIHVHSGRLGLGIIHNHEVHPLIAVDDLTRPRRALRRRVLSVSKGELDLSEVREGPSERWFLTFRAGIALNVLALAVTGQPLHPRVVLVIKLGGNRHKGFKSETIRECFGVDRSPVGSHEVGRIIIIASGTGEAHSSSIGRKRVMVGGPIDVRFLSSGNRTLVERSTGEVVRRIGRILNLVADRNGLALGEVGGHLPVGHGAFYLLVVVRVLGRLGVLRRRLFEGVQPSIELLGR